jgi:hypothetical protein
MDRPIASMYTPSVTYTYPGKLNLEIIEPSVLIPTPEISEFARVIQGIRCGEYLHLIQPLSTVLEKNMGNCNPTYSQGGSITDRQLLTGPFVINRTWCEEEFAAVCNGLVDSPLVAPGLDGNELTARLQTLIFKQIVDAARLDFWRLIFFGDNSLGAGSTNKFSAIDGVFTKFADAETAYCVQPIGNTFPNQHDSVLAANQARDAFRLMWGNSSIQLKSVLNQNKVFWVTGSVYENYYDSLIDNCCVEGSWQAGQDGINRLFYRGIEVKPLWFADESLSTDTTNPWYDEIRHFIIYTTRDNHMIGMERASDLNNLTMCFDCRTNENLIKGKMRFGYNFIECNLISVFK